MLRSQKITEEATSVDFTSEVSQLGMFCNYGETLAFTVDLYSKHFPHILSLFSVL